MKIDRSLLEKFYANACSDQEYKQVREWMHQVSEEEREWVLSELARRFQAGEVKPQKHVLMPFATVKQALPENQLITWPQALAAAALWLIILGAFLFRFFAHEPASHRLVSERGEFNQFYLPDSTELWLNAGSSLTYKDDFGKYDRQVVLEGEAYFDVSHNPQKPFVITSGALKTTVIGTSFNIKAYKQEAQAVTVKSGKVKVEYPEGEHVSTTYLTQGQQLVHGIGPDGKTTLDRVNQEVFTAWRADQLIFDQERLNVVFNTLERRFDKVIVCPDRGLFTTTIRSSYEATDFTTILEDLKFIAAFDYQLNGDTVLITPNP